VNVVVGAGSGMGEAVARLLAERGEVLLVDWNSAAVNDLAAELGSHVDALCCDMTVHTDLLALAARVDRLDALVVNAGLSPSMAPARRILEVNLRGVAGLLVALDGAVGDNTAAVCFASIAGHGHDYSNDVTAALDEPLAPELFDRLAAAGVDLEFAGGAYSLSKHGVIRLVRRLAKPWGVRGARIVTLSPGIIDTPMGQLEFDNAPVMKEMVAACPLGRPGRAEEVAAVAQFNARPTRPS
jgi:NAD(P)-dependent dehydrogenase (short-subunit alcohol dehydrogenase family)